MINEKNYQSTTEFLLKSLEIRKRNDNGKDLKLVDNYNKLGKVFYEQHLYKEALENYQKALEICKKKDNQEEISLITLSKCYEFIAILYESIDNTAKAIENYEESMEIWNKIYGVNNINSQSTKRKIKDLKHKIQSCSCVCISF